MCWASRWRNFTPRRLNVLRWLCLTTPGEEPSARLFFCLFAIEDRLRASPDGVAPRLFGQIHFRLRSNFKVEFPVMPWRATVSPLVKWESRWFFLRSSSYYLRFTGFAPAHGDPGGVKELSFPMTSHAEDEKFCMIREVGRSRIFRELLEEMMMARNVTMARDMKGEFGLPRALRPPCSADERE